MIIHYLGWPLEINMEAFKIFFRQQSRLNTLACASQIRYCRHSTLEIPRLKNKSLSSEFKAPKIPKIWGSHNSEEILLEMAYKEQRDNFNLLQIKLCQVWPCLDPMRKVFPDMQKFGILGALKFGILGALKFGILKP